jgi:hypothetical protein
MAYGITSESQLIDITAINNGCAQIEAAALYFEECAKKVFNASDMLDEKALAVDKTTMQPQLDADAEYIQSIKIAIENIGYHSVTSSPERLNRLFDTLDNPVFTVCFDVGHCLFQNVDPGEAIRKIGARLVDGCTHVHDNFGDTDAHTLPYYGKVDWEEVMKALAEIGYRGELNYEASNFIKDVPTDLYVDGLIYMAKVGRYLISRFEYYNKNN